MNKIKKDDIGVLIGIGFAVIIPIVFVAFFFSWIYTILIAINIGLYGAGLYLYFKEKIENNEKKINGFLFTGLGMTFCLVVLLIFGFIAWSIESKFVPCSYDVCSRIVALEKSQTQDTNTTQVTSLDPSESAVTQTDDPINGDGLIATSMDIEDTKTPESPLTDSELTTVGSTQVATEENAEVILKFCAKEPSDHKQVIIRRDSKISSVENGLMIADSCLDFSLISSDGSWLMVSPGQIVVEGITWNYWSNYEGWVSINTLYPIGEYTYSDLSLE